ncbi:GntR family transcriptional regulator [Georgenia sp. SUBG003]|uniref:GntR family transcriptional regulator n=1 Tax=Georgenia sp. SUBG003 TaxID=1497974 RepID=UPI003AB39D48
MSHPHRGIFVPVLAYDDLNDLFVARSAVERAAMVEVLAHGVPAATIAALEQVLGQMELAIQAHEWSGVVAADLRFHELIVEASGSPRLTRMHNTLSGETRLGFKPTRRRRRWRGRASGTRRCPR